MSFSSLKSQSLEIVYDQINVTNKVKGSFIYNADTIKILEKTAGCKYVDSLKLHKLDDKADYSFVLPDSLPDGKYGVFYNDKKKNLAFIVKYKNNKRNGSFLYFHYNGKVKKTGFYKDNCFDKVLVRYNKYGQTVGVINFSECKLNGVYLIFYSSGQLYSACYFKDGKRDGEYISYLYHDGRKMSLDILTPRLYQHQLYRNDTIIKDYLKPIKP